METAQQVSDKWTTVVANAKRQRQQRTAGVHLTIDTGSANRSNGGGPSSTSSSSTLTVRANPDDRKLSTSSVLTDASTLIGSPLTPQRSSNPSSSKWKGKQRAEPEQPPSPTEPWDPVKLDPTSRGYGTITTSDPEPIRAFGERWEREIMLQRVCLKKPEWAGELRALQRVCEWDEEAQLAFCMGYRFRYKRLFRYCPMAQTGWWERHIDARGEEESWWKIKELNRWNVSVMYGVYAVCMLIFWFHLSWRTPKHSP